MIATVHDSVPIFLFSALGLLPVRRARPVGALDA